jgi:hypothetical protein
LRGTSLISASGTPVLISSALGSIADGVGGGLYGTSGISGLAIAATSPFASETPLSGPTTIFNFNQPATSTSVPSGVGPGLGSSLNSRFIPSSGYFGGLMFSNASTAVSPYLITGMTTFTQTGPATFSANFASDNQGYYANAGISNGTGGLNTLNLTFGGNASGTPNSTIIDGNIFGATEGTGGATLNNGNDNQTSGTQSLYLLSSAAAPPPTTLLAGGTLCATCAYSQWGYWGGDVVSNFGQPNRIDLGHLNFWAAGQPFPSVNVPASGQATYSGSAIGSVNNSGNQYTATGTIAVTFNFGSNSGDVSLNFDGHSLTTGSSLAGLTNNGSRNTFTTNCDCNSLTGSNLIGQVSGTFFGPSNTPNTIPPEAGGSFALSSFRGPLYTAAGVFLSHK